MGNRWRARYRLRGSEREARVMAEALCIEQTVEFPADLVTDTAIREHVFGRLEQLRAAGPDHFEATLSFAPEIVAGELTQLLNVLFGNCSLLPGVRLVDIALSPEMLAPYQGPRFGIAGLRALLDAPSRPLLCTALKPMGLDARALAGLCGTLARGGIDIIKDDHGLANQPYSPFEERVARCADAAARASASTGRACLYAPNVTAPADELCKRAHSAKDHGAGALLVAPGLVGLDAMRQLAADDSLGLPILCHPALLGSYVLGPDSGIAHGMLLGRLVRLAGADASIFPSYGGRFSFSRAQCREVADACRRPLDPLSAIFPVPAGGMSLDRVPDLLAFYGADVAFLIGGDLHRDGDLASACDRFRGLVTRASAR